MPFSVEVDQCSWETSLAGEADADQIAFARHSIMITRESGAFRAAAKLLALALTRRSRIREPPKKPMRLSRNRTIDGVGKVSMRPTLGSGVTQLKIGVSCCHFSDFLLEK